MFGIGGARVHVADTSLFARFIDDDVQCLVYSMHLRSRTDVAMILPLPIRMNAREDAVSFVSFEDYPGFFDALRRLFDPPIAKDGERSLGYRAPARPRLAVHAVGAYEASFVPTMGDWDRLDPRFRLPTAVWSALGDYATYGFAVFRLAAGTMKRIHPMALRFRSRDTKRLFFPTIHVHDGRAHRTANFDHALYYQGTLERWSIEARGAAVPMHWASFDAAAEDYRGFVAPNRRVLRRDLRGKLPNSDTWIDPDDGILTVDVTRV
jgi:hypothetical protein